VLRRVVADYVPNIDRVDAGLPAFAVGFATPSNISQLTQDPNEPVPFVGPPLAPASPTRAISRICRVRATNGWEVNPPSACINHGERLGQMRLNIVNFAHRGRQQSVSRYSVKCVISLRTSLGLFAVLSICACHATIGGGGDTKSSSGGASEGTGTGPVAAGTEDDPQGQTDQEEQAPVKFTGTAIRSGDTDDGVADDSAELKTNFNLPVLQINELISAVHDMYTPGNAAFRKYKTVDEVNSTFMPSQATVDAVSSWITSNGMKVERVATNHMLIQVTATAGAFNKAFGTTVHKITRGNGTSNKTNTDAFGTPGDSLQVPAALIGKLAGVLALDVPSSGSKADTKGIAVDTTPPGAQAATLAVVKQLYGADSLPASGEGETLVIIGAGAVRPNDTASFWQGQGVDRDAFALNVVAEDVGAVNTEATLDIQWSAGLANKAAVKFYSSPDITDTALLFSFNEAVGKGEATVINDSYAHNEGIIPIQVRVQYDRSALAGAAQGITIVSSSGDRSAVDAPGASPYVLSVGGLNRDNTVWNGSGGGQSANFAIPAWQKNIVFDNPTHRATPDVASLADDLWYYTEGYSQAGGTSFSSPITSGLIAVLNSVRTQAGKPRVGWLNSILYTNKDVQAALKDVTSGESGSQQARDGWDYTSGWGALNIAKLADVVP
jgi:kumamolisin